jgi:hypothetical protein
VKFWEDVKFWGETINIWEDNGALYPSRLPDLTKPIGGVYHALSYVYYELSSL